MEIQISTYVKYKYISQRFHVNFYNVIKKYNLIES